MLDERRERAETPVASTPDKAQLKQGLYLSQNTPNRRIASARLASAGRFRTPPASPAQAQGLRPKKLPPVNGSGGYRPLSAQPESYGSPAGHAGGHGAPRSTSRASASARSRIGGRITTPAPAPMPVGLEALGAKPRGSQGHDLKPHLGGVQFADGRPPRPHTIQAMAPGVPGSFATPPPARPASEAYMQSAREKLDFSAGGGVSLDRIPENRDSLQRGAGAMGRPNDIEVKPWYSFLSMLREHLDSLEFVYLSPAGSNLVSYNPYDLEIVAHSDITEGNFYTMSAAGVTHFCDNQAEFTPLDQWEREYHLYNQISTLNVFRQYKIWKGFATWRRYVRRKKTRHCQAMLQKHLFSLHPIFQPSLLHIRKVCYELGELRLHKMEQGEVYPLEDFMELQEEQRAAVAEALRGFSVEMVATVEGACSAVLSQLDERLFGSKGGDEGAEGGARGAEEKDKGRDALFKDPPRVQDVKGALAAAAREAEDNGTFSYAITAARRSEQRRLLNYIRLGEYIITDTLRVLLLDSIGDMLQLLSYRQDLIPKETPVLMDVPEDPAPAPPAASPAAKDKSKAPGAAAAGQAGGAPPPEAKATGVEAGAKEEEGDGPEAAPPPGVVPVFEVHVLHDDEQDELVFTPAAPEFSARVMEAVDGFIGVLGTVPRLLTHEQLMGFTGDLGVEMDNQAGRLVDMVESDQPHQLVTELSDSLELALDDAEDYKGQFAPYRDEVVKNRLVDASEMREAILEGRRTLDDFREDIQHFQAQHAEMLRLVTRANMGILCIMTSELKESFLPSPLGCLDKIFALLPVLALEKYTEFIIDVHDTTLELSQVPTTVEEFADLLAFLSATKERYRTFDVRMDEVCNYYDLMDEFKIPVPEMDLAAYKTVGPDYNALRTVMDMADARRDEYVVQFNRDLNKEVEELKGYVTDIRLQAQAEIILSLHDHGARTAKGAEPHPDYVDKVLEYTGRLVKDVSEQKAAGERIQRFQSLMGVPETRYEELEECVEEVELKHAMWASIKDWAELREAWSQQKFDDIDVEAMEEKVMKYGKTVMRLERGLPPNKVAPHLKAMVQEFKDVMPVIQNLRNPDLKDRHWVKVEEAIGQPVVRDEHFTLGYLVELKVMDVKDRIVAISTEATQESALEVLLHKVQTKWQAVEFTVNPYKDAKDTYILGGVDEVIAALDDSMVTMSTITASRFVAGIRAEVDKMEKSLRLFQDTLDEWLECQKQWMYLESIFSAQDIQRQLPAEAKAFFAVDKTFKDVMRRTRDRSNALQAGTTPGWFELFQKNNETLEKVQKNLEDYLETKRMAFPRFYFLSNDELLEILAQTKNVQAVQPHMSKCFDGIKSLDFGSDPKSIDIFAMISGEGENVSLGKNLKARGNVEQWLTAVEQAMASSLKKMAKAGYQSYPESKRTEWVMQQPAQLVIMVSQIYWVAAAEECLRSSDVPGQLGSFLAKNISDLGDLTGLVRGNLSSLARKVLVALITIDVHARDIVETLIETKVAGPQDFTWQMQLRYTWDQETDDTTVRQVNAQFVYGYEYLGAQSRLVVTPMTDRCYMTLTGALHLKLGGAPAGPAGTGKTETTKDLGKALGVQCVVFNCGDNLDYKFMGKFFSGLAQCGAWACFDEFNRIDIEVLSVVAQQLLTIQNALKAEVSKFTFEGREIRLIATCGVFITMNPGYAGRTELPDNLKALFRPMSMMVPDYGLVAEVMLFAEGFGDAKALSRKMVKLYKLSSEQLSQQDHYDFGMRAVKSVLVMAGSLKRANMDLPEDAVLIRAFKDSNLPKFLADDKRLFLAIISDLFPGVAVPDQDYGQLKAVVEEVIEEDGLQAIEPFVIKVIQLYETFNVRFGVMLVGPTGGGKTQCYRMLKAAMTRLRERGHPDEGFQKTHTYVFNPKCIKMGELYGEYNLLTNEWTDGLGSTLIRNAVADTTMERKWVVFDGPVDAIWIENMNTVLDDNCTLCLPNGERIKLNAHTMRMLFEVQDLAVASPATVSRCGMVYVPPEDAGWRPYVQTWLSRLNLALSDEDKTVSIPGAIKEHIYALFDLHVDAGLAFIKKSTRSAIPSVDINLVCSLAMLYQSLLHRISRQLADRGGAFDNLTEDSTEAVKEVVNKLFVFAYLWSVGGNVDASYWDYVDEFVRNEFDSTCSLPMGGALYDYFVDTSTHDTGHFGSWDNIVPAFKYRSDVPYFDLMVPTVDTTRYSYLLEALLEVDKAVLFTGLSGVGKTAIMADLLARSSGPKGLVPLTINFSAQTTAIATQETIEAKLEKKRKTKLGAPPGKKAVLFVDDVNMPARETYGAQPPVELLRQFMDFRGFYDRKKLFWKDIEDMTLVAACAPPGGGRQEVTPRFFRHFNMLCVAPPSEVCMRTIFMAIVNGFLGGFSNDFKPMAKPMVDSSVEVYLRISQELLPTPAKSHYTFNLRDVSKVFQGILMMTPRCCPTKDVMARLWVHENMRVFHDRLINDEDKAYFTNMLYDMLRSRFEVSESHDELFVEREPPIMFGDYMRMGATGDDRVYEEVADATKLNRTLEDYLEEYNHANTRVMNLVFFKDAISHVNRISRVLRQPRGNAMLVGVGGSGKQSLTRYAAFMAEYVCFQIELTRGYGSNEFREDLKQLYKTAGIDGVPVVFLFTDNQIVEESFLEDINNMLNSGEVPGLLAPDEKERMIADIRPYAEAKGLPQTRDGLYTAFINRVRDNLHIVLAMSPVGEAFRARCRQFPSLINCCTIDWFQEWPEEALRSVSKHFLAKVNLGDEAVHGSIAEMCVEIHQNVAHTADAMYNELRRKYYITPKSYLDLINLYVSLLLEKRNDLEQARDRLVNGLNKLQETNTVVDTMKAELNALQPVLEEKSKQTAVLLEQVSKDEAEAVKVKESVSVVVAEVTAQAIDVQKVKDDAEADLNEVLPVLEMAQKALNALNKGDITEIKSFAKPPALVQMTMEAVCILCGEKPDWDSAKKLLSDMNFIKRLMEYDTDNIPDKVLKQLAKYIGDPQFDPETVAKQSNAAKSLCMWARAMDSYAKVVKVVEPKRKVLREAQAELDTAQASLAAKQAELQAVEDNVAALQKQLKDAEDEQQSLQEQADLATARLSRAGKLTSALGDEAVRWTETAAGIEASMVLLVGDVFLSSACVSYYGAFTGQYRAVLVDGWVARCKELGIPVSDECSLRGTLASPVEVREWNIWGLPTDSVSIDNGILVTRGRRWPLMIDPQGQANKWVKAMEAKNGLRCIKLTDPNFLRTLENSIRIGNPVLLEDVGEHLDPALEPVLQKQTFMQGNRMLIRLGDSDVDYDPHFKFYMCTKMPNPHYLPETCIKVTLINFTVTMKGLEDQLLGDVVRKEQPELEEKNDRLVVSISNDKKQLKDLEEKILKLLKESEGNILDDEVLINTLNNSKLTSGVIEGRVKDAEVTEKEINELREGYRPVPVRGSILYFVIADLALIDNMYQYSLAYFTQMFNNCIDASEKSDDKELRMETLIRYTTEFMFTNVCRGLFEEHKMIYSFLICTSIVRNEGQIVPAEWNFLLRGAPPPASLPPNPDPSWISQSSWEMVSSLEGVAEAFKGLAADVEEHTQSWKAFAEAEEPMLAALPGEWGGKVDQPFRKLLLVRVLCEQGLVLACQHYVRETLGRHFVENPPFKLADIYKDTTNATPIIFILSTGADPTGMLQRFGELHDHAPGDRLHTISLGQGQGPVADAIIVKARKSGDWVCLQNCHLASSWMLQLEKNVESLQRDAQEIHPDFRLWLTSMPAKTFPVPVLQNGIKVTTEPPKGVRANMMGSYSTMDDDFLSACEKPAAWRKLVFSVSFFHAVIQERRKFGPLGWNIRYDFSNSDLECSLQTLRMFLDEGGAGSAIPWPALLYVTGQINYGGRVTDDNDRRTLLSILGKYYVPDVLGDAYAFTPSGTYRAPPDGAHASYMDAIRAFPLTEGPEVFGMHDNAHITFQLQESRALVSTVLSIQPRLTTGGAGKSPEEIVSDLAKEIAEGLPAELLRDNAVTGSKDPFAPIPSGHANSLGTVLGQEMDRFNTLVGRIRSSLSELQRALQGLVVMSGDLEKMNTAMLNNQVPALWAQVAYPSLKPLASWVRDFQERMRFMRGWLEEGEPSCFWMPGFFFPQGFLTGALQNHARKYQIAIDTLNFGFKATDWLGEYAQAEVAPPEDGIYVSGLFIDGGRWDHENKQMCEAAHGEMHTPLPVMHFTPVVNYVPPEDEYQCPLYKTSVRAGVLSTTGQSTNYVLAMSIPIAPHTNPDFWVLQGVAALCALDD